MNESSSAEPLTDVDLTRHRASIHELRIKHNIGKICISHAWPVLWEFIQAFYCPVSIYVCDRVALVSWNFSKALMSQEDVQQAFQSVSYTGR